jgi:ribosomal-protein-alanine N-acetyltransferase
MEAGVGGRWHDCRLVVDDTPPTLETERLLLVPLDRSRLEAFVALTADPEVMCYWAPEGAFTRERAEENFTASLARFAEYGFGRRWIVVKDSGAGIGFTETKYFGVRGERAAPDQVEIGFMLDRTAWGHGYATEAGAAICAEVFERLDLDLLHAVYHPANRPSQRVLEKLGMQFERELSGSWPLRLYRLTRAEWQEQSR